MGKKWQKRIKRAWWKPAGISVLHWVIETIAGEILINAIKECGIVVWWISHPVISSLIVFVVGCAIIIAWPDKGEIAKIIDKSKKINQKGQTNRAYQAGRDINISENIQSVLENKDIEQLGEQLMFGRLFRKKGFANMRDEDVVDWYHSYHKWHDSVYQTLKKIRPAMAELFRSVPFEKNEYPKINNPGIREYINRYDAELKMIENFLDTLGKE